MIIDTSKTKAVKTVRPRQKKFDADKACAMAIETIKKEQAGELSESEMMHLNLFTMNEHTTWE